MKTTINFHLWQPCNIRCTYCFARFLDVKETVLPKGHLPKHLALEVVKQIGQHFKGKISFAGGEPTLCPWLPELIREAKHHGLTTMIITNGTRLNEEFLSTNKEFLDWITLSVDSLYASTNEKIGRKVPGKNAFDLRDYLNLCQLIKSYGYRIKINTVVSRLNLEESFTEFIKEVKPERWKIFQVLRIEGQNDKEFDAIKISEQEFAGFLKRHEILSGYTTIIPENNDDMTGSYLMIDPAGRFYDNKQGFYKYSDPVYNVGVEKALSQIDFSYTRLVRRKGIYQWESDNGPKSNL